MVIRIASLLLSLALVYSVARADEITSLPYRRVPELDLVAFACAPEPANYQIKSQVALELVLERFDRDCSRFVDSELRKADFLGALRAANINFERETLIVLEGWYGTGMAKASLNLMLTSPETVTAAITWHVRPPPVTPDTAVYRFDFAVDRARITKVEVTAIGQQNAALHVAK